MGNDQKVVKKRVVKKSKKMKAVEKNKVIAKKPKSSKDNVPPRVPNEDGVPVVALTREHLLEAELLVSKTETASAKASDKHKTAELLEQKTILQVRSLRHDAMLFEQEAQALIVERTKFWAKLGKIYDIDFNNAGYDDQTGIITIDPRINKSDT